MKNARAGKRIVVKLGTGVLTDRQQKHDIPQMRKLVAQVAELVKKRGFEVVIVSSSAICAGMNVLKLKQRPTSLPEKQACAAVGQCRLMTIYQQLFARHKINVAQVLLTHGEIDSRTSFRNAQNTLDRLLSLGIVPIINENDTVAVEEIKFGDNDRLSAAVAEITRADHLVILSMIKGLLTDLTAKGRLISQVDVIDDSIRKLARGTDSGVSVGGMISKIQAAEMATSAGIPVTIAHGREAGILLKIGKGQKVGTYFSAVRPAHRHYPHV